VIAPLADGIPDALAAQAEENLRTHMLEQQQRRGSFAIYNLGQR
jgi:hypothetical protein